MDRVKQLGNTIEYTLDGNQLVMRVKTAMSIDKNNSICQEFFFAHPQTKNRINTIYNSHFTGSQLWKFGSREMGKLESTYNRAIKIMFDLPWGTHRYLLEPLTGQPHISRILIQRYLSFIVRIESSKKGALRTLLNIVKKDSRTVTGSNLRFIMLLANKNTIEEVTKTKVVVKYQEVSEENNWKPNFVKEIVDIRHKKLTVEEFEKDELDEILEYLCTG